MSATQRQLQEERPMKKIIDSLKKYDDFLLVSHLSPDGDTLGSTAALFLALKQLGKRAVAAVDGAVPDKLRFLNDYCEFCSPEVLSKEEFECAVAIDVADIPRLGRLKDAFLASEHTLVIDHHPTNTEFGEYNLIDCKASTGEVVMEIIDSMGAKIDDRIANCLYAAVSTDTGNFIYSSVTEETLKNAARLRGCGADIPRLAAMIYSERSLGATKIIGRGIDSLSLFSNGRIAALSISKKDIEECGAKREDTDSLINYAREIKGVEIAIFVNELSGGRAKVSLRSNEYADVAEFAKRFGGGGHVHAAGYTDNGSVEEIRNRAVEYAAKLLK